jgi:hypothetical protein
MKYKYRVYTTGGNSFVHTQNYLQKNPNKKQGHILKQVLIKKYQPKKKCGVLKQKTKLKI